jgi:transmembrane sensor
LKSRSKRLNAQVREQASEWLVCFSEGEVDAQAREAFTRWLRTSPEHVWAYLRISAFWHDAELISKATGGDIDALVERALSENNVVPLREGDRVSAPPTIAQRRFPRWAIAAAWLIVCVGSLFAVLQFRGGQSYATGIGELRTVTLADGSKVELNARSRINVRFSDSRRYIELLEGQVLFSVAKDAARPFIVRSGSTDVKAVGTQFDVNRKPTGTVVTVFEGSVAVSQAATTDRVTSVPAVSDVPRVMLSPGDQVTVTTGTITPAKKANLAQATAWTEGLLMFDSAPLSEVVREFNRHNVKPMVIMDARLQDVRISGIFPATGAQRLTGFLRERFGIAVQESDEAIRLSTEPAPGSSESSLNFSGPDALI